MKETVPMTTVRNVAREKLEQGQLSLGVGVRMTRSVEIAKAMATELPPSTTVIRPWGRAG